jgi:hypothetical protein
MLAAVGREQRARSAAPDGSGPFITAMIFCERVDVGDKGDTFINVASGFDVHEPGPRMPTAVIRRVLVLRVFAGTMLGRCVINVQTVAPDNATFAADEVFEFAADDRLVDRQINFEIVSNQEGWYSVVARHDGRTLAIAPFHIRHVRTGGH